MNGNVITAREVIGSREQEEERASEGRRGNKLVWERETNDKRLIRRFVD